RKLAIEEAKLVHDQGVLGLPIGQASLPRTPQPPAGTAAVEPRFPRTGAPTYSPYVSEPPTWSVPERDREKREAQAFFASNIALSYRQVAASPREPAELAPARAAAAPASIAAPSESAKSTALSAWEPPSAGTSAPVPDREGLARAEGNRHRLFE